MRHFILASLTMVFLCYNVSEAQKINAPIGKSVNQTSPKIFVKDKSKYSKVFLTELNALKLPNNSSIKLIDNVIIFGNKTIKFPDDMKMNNNYIFEAVKGEQSYQLNVKRINESTLNFEFKLFKKNHIVYSDKGEANIAASFIIDPEIDVDDQSGKGYDVYQYTKELNNCWFVIRIGVGKDAKNKQRAKVIFGCKDKTKPALDLKDCPTLRTK
jgi:hypothetical protein